MSEGDMKDESVGRAELVAILGRTPGVLEELTADCADEVLDFRSGAEAWTMREILAHLVDDEMFVMRTRLERIIKEDVPNLPAHDEKRWYSQRNTARDDIQNLLGDFAVQRAASLNIFALLRDEDWARKAYHPEYGQFTAEEWLGSWAQHDQVHIRQIQKKIELALARGKQIG